MLQKNPWNQEMGSNRFCRTLPDELNRDAYKIERVAKDKLSKIPTVKEVFNTTAFIAMKIMQSYICNQRVPPKIRCDHAQLFRLKNIQLLLLEQTIYFSYLHR